MTGGLTAGDVLALSRDGGAMDWSWIVGLLVIAGIFSGGLGFGNRAGITEDYVANQFTQRDIFNTNTDVLENRYNNLLASTNTDKEVLENRYNGALAMANTQKDILLGNAELSNQLSSCCCELKTAVHAEGEATRNMIQQDKIEQLRDQVYSTNLALSNANLANQIINSVRPFPTPSYPVGSPYVSLYNPYNGCGCTNGTII